MGLSESTSAEHAMPVGLVDVGMENLGRARHIQGQQDSNKTIYAVIGSQVRPFYPDEPKSLWVHQRWVFRNLRRSCSGVLRTLLCSGLDDFTRYQHLNDVSVFEQHTG